MITILFVSGVLGGYWQHFIDGNDCIRGIRSQKYSDDFIELSTPCTTKNICKKNWIGNNAFHVAAKLCNRDIIKYLRKRADECFKHRTWIWNTVEDLWRKNCALKHGNLIGITLYICF